MSTGLSVFDTTVQETNVWLKEVEARLQPCDRARAYDALRAVLHMVRDRVPVDAVAGLSAQLPMLLRGVYFEGWRPGLGPSRLRDEQAFAEEVQARLPPGFPREAPAVLEAVFHVMAHRLDPGETHKLQAYLPAALKVFWPVEYRAA